MPPSVSIIIPCKNAGRWIGEAIESCLEQTWPNIEIIVVDNGSSDDSLAVANSYRAASIRIFECARAGASAARNVGIQHSRGELVQFLDADDVLDNQKIQTQVERLGHYPEGTVASGAWGRFRYERSDAVFVPDPVWRDFAPGEFLISSWLGGGMMAPLVWLTPRSVIEKAGPWNEGLSLNDDGEFFCRILLASAGVAFCEGARGYYRTLPVPTLSRRRDPAAFNSAFKAAELSCEHLLKYCTSEAARKACAYHFQRFIYDVYPDMPELIKAAELRVSDLGGSDLKIGGGRLFNELSKCFGWKFARQCQVAWNSLRERSPKMNIAESHSTLRLTR